MKYKKTLVAGIATLALATLAVTQTKVTKPTPTPAVMFGSDGSVEWERFKIFNPPILVPNGTKRQITDKLGNSLELNNFKVDELAALRKTLAHTIKVSGKENTKIIKGKIGNTTATFYPQAGTGGGNVSVDGTVFRAGIQETWVTIRAGAGTGNDQSSTAYPTIWSSKDAGGNYTNLYRAILTSDTSSLTSSATISAATFSVYGNYADNSSGSLDVALVGSTPAANNALANADFSQLGSTDYATRITVAAFSTVAYNDYALNASGLAAISKTGITKFGLREGSHDIDNVDPNLTNNDGAGVYIEFADNTGTTIDPKLVVTYTSPHRIIKID